MFRKAFALFTLVAVVLLSGCVSTRYVYVPVQTASANTVAPQKCVTFNGKQICDDGSATRPINPDFPIRPADSLPPIPEEVRRQCGGWATPNWSGSRWECAPNFGRGLGAVSTTTTTTAQGLCSTPHYTQASGGLFGECQPAGAGGGTSWAIGFGFYPIVPTVTTINIGGGHHHHRR